MLTTMILWCRRIWPNDNSHDPMYDLFVHTDPRAGDKRSDIPAAGWPDHLPEGWTDHRDRLIHGATESCWGLRGVHRDLPKWDIRWRGRQSVRRYDTNLIQSSCQQVTYMLYIYLYVYLILTYFLIFYTNKLQIIPVHKYKQKRSKFLSR